MKQNLFSISYLWIHEIEPRQAEEFFLTLSEGTPLPLLFVMINFFRLLEKNVYKHRNGVNLGLFIVLD